MTEMAIEQKEEKQSQSRKEQCPAASLILMYDDRHPGMAWLNG